VGLEEGQRWVSVNKSKQDNKKIKDTESLHVLNHFPSMVHVIITLPIAI
jgi:hypothetical protein